MKSKTVIKTSVFPATKQEVFEKLKAIQTLQYIAYPYATFTPVNASEEFVWQAGKTFSFRFKLFGIIPFGVHSINVIEFDQTTARIYTKEENPHVPVWNHLILLKPLDDSRLLYTDEVEILAGWKTPFVALWAKSFYAHRQRKWLRLLRNQGASLHTTP